MQETEIQVRIPGSSIHTCNGCLFLSFNYVDVCNGKKTVGVYCRLKQKHWIANQNEVIKPEECPSYELPKDIIEEINALEKKVRDDVRERKS